MNSVRFIAASLVIIAHIEEFKHTFNLPHFFYDPVIAILGRLGVILFFVLSGFLITHLLLTEKESAGKINIKNFYIRRILRIWPLYYLIVLTSLFIIPHIGFFSIPGSLVVPINEHFTLKALCYLSLFPNVAIALLWLVPYASQTWSIGAEEQFYLIWPLLMQRFKSKWALMFSVIAIYMIIEFIPPHISGNESLSLFENYWKAFPVDCMAIGGLFSLMVFNRTSSIATTIRNILFNRFFQLLTFLVTILLILQGIHFKMFHSEIYALLFGIFICNLSSNDKRIINLETPVLNYLGKISYGLYMYHPIAIVIAIKALMMLGLKGNYYLYPLAMILSILFAGVSYKYFEKRFINRKKKYSTVISGDNVLEVAKKNENKYAVIIAGGKPTENTVLVNDN